MFSLQPADLELAPMMIILVIILAAMLQDDVTCTTVGVLAANGSLSLPMAWGACFVGTLLGDLVWFTLARWCGPRLLSTRPLKWVIKPPHLEKAAVFVERYGSLSIFLCRFLPGIRTALQLVIGTLHKNVARAVLVFTLAAVLYTLLIFGLCRIFHKTVDVLGIYEAYGQPAMLVSGIAVLSVIGMGKWVLRLVSGVKMGGTSASQQDTPRDEQHQSHHDKRGH
ncbi:MAG TPA: DedA family protein [Fuerstia sp.]|nr:DedA family protein [Fuerstiella sp.]